MQDTDGNQVLKNLSTMNSGKKFVIAKHISKQLDGLDRTLLYTSNSKHVILVRDPLDMISSWNVKNEVHKEGCSLEATSLPHMVQLYSDIRQNTGHPPVVVDSNILKSYPREILTSLCAELSIPFFEEQLSWPAGPKPDIDG